MEFSRRFGLNKSQAELDFVDIQTDGDIPLFVDPFAISQKPNRWALEAHRTIISYFQQVIDAIRTADQQRAYGLLSNLHEPNETRLGFSSRAPQGAGIGRFQADQLLNALSESAAVRTGFITNLEECELLIPNISRDKISDLTTNIIRKHLADYTVEQCVLHNVPTNGVPVAPYFDAEQLTWVNDFYNLPVVAGMPILLVPKSIVRWDPSYNHRKYYNHFVLNYLQSEHINAQSALVHTLKNGSQRVYKKDLKFNYPVTRRFLDAFSREHPEVLEEYRQYLAGNEEQATIDTVTPENEQAIAHALITTIRSIQPGNDEAENYHSLMVGIIEFLFFPHLVQPVKEHEIHQGRKRIDISTENGARHGIFHDLHAIRHIPCSFVYIECKNYSRDVANPELDQLSSRFSVNRGQVGILACRGFQNAELFLQRCRDTFQDGRGLVIPLDDSIIVQMLDGIANGQRSRVLALLREQVNLVSNA